MSVQACTLGLLLLSLGEKQVISFHLKPWLLITACVQGMGLFLVSAWLHRRWTVDKNSTGMALSNVFLLWVRSCVRCSQDWRSTFRAVKT